MPYSSDKQRRWMHANKPEIAQKWDKKYGSKPKANKPKPKKKSALTDYLNKHKK